MRKGSISRQKHYFVSPKLFLLFSRHPVLIPLTKVQKIDLTGVTQFFGDPVVYIAPTNKDRNRHLTGGKPVAYLEGWPRECMIALSVGSSANFSKTTQAVSPNFT